MRQTRWTFESDDAPAAHATRRSFVAFALTALDGASVDVSGAELVLGELIGNVKRYAPGPVVVAAEWQRRAVRITVTDSGGGFSKPPAARPADLFAESGRGLYLVNALASEIEVSCPHDGGCAVTATIPFCEDGGAG